MCGDERDVVAHLRGQLCLAAEALHEERGHYTETGEWTDCSDETCRSFVAALARPPPVPEDGKESAEVLRAYLEWVTSTDVGYSAAAIFQVATGIRCIRNQDVRHSTPHDRHDFGRCRRLLLRFPHFRAHMPKLAEVGFGWPELLARWDEMTAMWDAGDMEGVERLLKHWGGNTWSYRAGGG